MDRPGLLHVLVEIVVNLAFFAGLQILDVELRPRPVAFHIDQPPAIRRWRRADRAAGTAGDLPPPAGFDVLAVDRDPLGVGVLGLLEAVARRGRVGEIDSLAVWREPPADHLLHTFWVGPP